MNNMDIDTLYNDMLKTADDIVKNGITKEYIEKLEFIEDQVSDVCENSTDDSEQSSSITEMDNPSLNDPNGTKVMTIYNPTNGEQMVVETEPPGNISEKHWNSFVTDSDNLELDTDIIKNILSNNEIKNINDFTKMASLMSRRMGGETFNYYNELPDNMKYTVDSMIADIGKNGQKITQRDKNTIAKILIDNLIEEYKKSNSQDIDLDTMLTGFDDDLRKMQNDMSSELAGMMMSFDEERKAEIDAAIARCEAEGKTESIDKLKKIKNTISSAYDLNEFSEFCKTVKIKKSEVDKPKKVFQSFNFKYEKHKNTINDISACPYILDRHLHEYTYTQKLLVCLAFCKYCMNMSPDNIEDHTFMYYFIRNIIAIDRLNPKGNIYESMDQRSKDFYDNFTLNLSKCINNLLERNITFK